MTVDPRIIAACLRDAADRPYLGHRLLLLDAVDLIEQILVPLHGVWLQAKPPCPTCGGVGIEPLNPKFPKSVKLCPDCPDGVQPFDKWTAGLVALWMAVQADTYPAPPVQAGRLEADAHDNGCLATLALLRQIGTR